MPGTETPAGKAIRERLDDKDWSQAELARQASVNPGTIGDLFTGIRQPAPRTRRKIEQVLGWPEGTIAGLISGELLPEQVRTLSVDESSLPGHTPDSGSTHVTVDLDLPESVWQEMSDTERAEVLHAGAAAALERLRKIQSGQ